MSDELQKSKKVRDIRERLGRKTGPPPPQASEEGGVAPPPPALGGIAPPPGFVGGQAAKRSGPFGGTTAKAPARSRKALVATDDPVEVAELAGREQTFEDSEERHRHQQGERRFLPRRKPGSRVLGISH